MAKRDENMQEYKEQLGEIIELLKEEKKQGRQPLILLAGMLDKNFNELCKELIRTEATNNTKIYGYSLMLRACIDVLSSEEIIGPYRLH